MDKKFTIAFYCSSISWGGLEMNIFKRAVWWKELGHHVILYCVNNSPLYREAENNLDTRVVEKNSKGLDLKNARKLKKLFREDQIEIIWCTDKRDIAVLGFAKNLRSKKLKLLYQQQMQFGIPKRDFWHTYIFNKIDYWIAPLNYLKEQVKTQTKYPVEKVHVIPLSMDIDQFKSSLPARDKAREYFNLGKEDFVIGMMGRIDFAKSQQFVKDVVAEFIPKNDQLRMLMVGNKTEGEWEDYYNHLHKDVETNYKNKEIQIYPFMKEVGYFYQAIDAFVMASKNETFGMVTIEAMLSERIVIGTESAGTKELLHGGDHGYYFNWMDAESLRNALTIVLANKSEALKKAESAMVYAESAFSHLIECDQIYKIFTHS